MNSSAITKNLKVLVLLSFGIIVTYFTGCSNSTTNPVMTDDEFLQEVIQKGYGTPNDPENLMSLDTSDYNDGGAVPDSGTGPLSPIDSLLRWGRRIVSVDLNLTITNSSDTMKTVNIKRTINGDFIIMYQHNGQVLTVTKPYTQILYRNVIFKRVARNRDPHFNWRIYSISLLSGGTTLPQNGSIHR